MVKDRPIIVITNWDAYFETHESRRVGKCSWVAVPNKHDGKGFRRLISQKNGAAIFGAWVLLLQVASKCPVRGVLADLDGAIDTEDLQDNTGIPAKIFEQMLDFITADRIAWAKKVTDPEEIHALLDQVTGCAPGSPRKRPGSAPGAPSQTSNLPAENGTSPAECGQNEFTRGETGTHPQFPAAARTSRARAGGQDRT